MHANALPLVRGAISPYEGELPRSQAGGENEGLFAEMLALFLGGRVFPQWEELSGRSGQESQVATISRPTGFSPVIHPKMHALHAKEALAGGHPLGLSCEDTQSSPGVPAGAVEAPLVSLESEARQHSMVLCSTEQADKHPSFQLLSFLTRGELAPLGGAQAWSVPPAREEVAAVSRPEGLYEQLRMLFAQALERVLSGARMELPTVAQLRLELSQLGQLVLFVSVRGEQVFVHVETPSPEFARQFVAVADGLQHMLLERQLRLGEVTVRFADSTPTSGNFSHSSGGSQKDALSREREQFVRSFRWYRLQGPTS